MMAKIHFRYSVWFFFIIWLSYPFHAEASTNEKTFPIPLATVEAAVTDWLQANGFRIYRTHVNPQQTDIRAEKASDHWHIVIVPQSALASHVKAQFRGPGDDTMHNPYRPLWLQISKQINSSLPSRDKVRTPIPTQIYRHAEAVVCMQGVTDGDAKQISGFFLRAREGLILTTAHDLTAFQNLIVTLSSGQEVKGQVIQLDQQLDLALIRVASSPNMGILLHKSRNLLIRGDRLFTVVCSSNGQGKLTTGVVDGPPRRADNQLLWQVKMAVLPGNSGSPVFDDNGRLVAVVKGRHRVEDNIGFLIPMKTVMAFIKANIDYVK